MDLHWICFQGFESYLRTIRVSEENIELLLDLFNSRFVNFELPPGVYEMTDIKNTINDLVKVSVVTDDVTLEKSSNTDDNSRFHEKSLFSILLGSTPNADYMPNTIHFSRKNISINPIDIIHSKFQAG